MWQKCPICNGTGSDPNWLVHNGNIPKCPTCKGERIISELTGKPPCKNEFNDKEKFIKDSLSLDDFKELATNNKIKLKNEKYE